MMYLIAYNIRTHKEPLRNHYWGLISAGVVSDKYGCPPPHLPAKSVPPSEFAQI